MWYLLFIVYSASNHPSLSLDEIIDTRTNFVETIESHIERIDRIVDD